MDMADLEKKETLLEDVDHKNKRCCLDCRTTKTPLWRGGPSGPRSLCNACGIRYRKKTILTEGLTEGLKRGRRENTRGSSTSTISNTSTTNPAAAVAAADFATSTTTRAKIVDSGGRDLRETLKVRIVALGKEVLLHQTQKKEVFLQQTEKKEMFLQQTKEKEVFLQQTEKGEVLLQGAPPVGKKQKRCQRKRRREWGEVEQAAVCLLAMSSDSVFG